MEKEIKRCTVLGSNGYIGRHMCYFLNTLGYKVFAYDTSEDRHSSLPESIPYHPFDIRDPKSVAHLKLNVHYLFIFSGVTGTKISFEQYQLFTEVNEIGLLNVLDKVRELDQKPHVVFPSSRLVYKGSESPIREDGEKEAKTIYAANKLNCERFLETYHQMYDIPYTVFRICVPYGNMFDDAFSYGTIGFFLSQSRKGESIKLYGDGSLRRTFTHIEFLCEQIITVINQHPKETVFNIAGDTHTLKEAAELISNKYEVKIEHVSWPEEDLKLESGHTAFDSHKIESFVLRRPTHSLKSWIDLQ